MLGPIRFRSRLLHYGSRRSCIPTVQVPRDLRWACRAGREDRTSLGSWSDFLCRSVLPLVLKHLKARGVDLRRLLGQGQGLEGILEYQADRTLACPGRRLL